MEVVFVANAGLCVIECPSDVRCKSLIYSSMFAVCPPYLSGRAAPKCGKRAFFVVPVSV